MELKISTIAAIPQNVERSYYLYILDYYNWAEPIDNTLRNSFDKIAKFAAENDSVAIHGIPESHFYSELMSWESVNGIDSKELLPALMITTIHPQYFLEEMTNKLTMKKFQKTNWFVLKLVRFVIYRRMC
jgi:hypothetical protein